MGLAISVGFQADLKHNDSEGYAWAKAMFADVQSYLKEEGHSAWDEPDETFDIGMRRHVSSFPYSYAHYLRRAYAYMREYPDRPVTPTESMTSKDESVIEDAGSMLSSHLICHSDCEGLYVPIKFGDPLFDLDSGRVPGTMLGSSYNLQEELREVAPYIGVKLDDGELSDNEAQRLFDVESGQPFWREKIVFLTLWEASRASIAHQTAIVFC